MNILFMGTPDFALEAIKVLDESKHNVLGAGGLLVNIFAGGDWEFVCVEFLVVGVKAVGVGIAIATIITVRADA